MTAALIVPSLVQKTYEYSTKKTGTPIRLVRYFFKGTKVNDSDWIVTATYFQSGTPLLWNAITIDTSGNGISEVTVGMTYTASGTKLTLAGGTTGTTYGEIWFEDAG